MVDSPMVDSPLVDSPLVDSPLVDSPSGNDSSSDDPLLEFFERRIRPVLVDHCYECHNSQAEREGGLAVDYRDGLLQGGWGGPVIDRQQPSASRLLQTLRHELEGLEMPSGRPKLADQVIQDFTRWIESGAVDPRGEPPSAEALAAEMAWPEVRQRRQQAWAFQPIRRPSVPGQQNDGQAIDAFIRQELERQQLQPAEQAAAGVLVRRLYLTVLGLPPTADEARWWTQRLQGLEPALRDQHYAELVDHLLASPHFGERWARHWMDWIRYAESHGSEGDPVLVNAHYYRDYLIRSLNQDLPYDHLIREHVAGDLMPHPRINHELGINESRLATAHWRMVFHGFAPTDPLDEQVRFIDDQINVFSKAFLGLTVSCARCHDHKFDPIGQDDYYALYGVLRSNRAARHPMDVDPAQPATLARLEQLKPAIRTAIVRDWQADLAGFRQRLGQWMRAPSPEAAATTGWGFLQRVAVEDGSQASVAELWRAEQAAWRARQVAPAMVLGHHSDSRDPEEASLAQQVVGQQVTTWLDGQGQTTLAAAAGQFAVADDGDRALLGIYPRGFYSHLLSSKLPAILTSDDLPLQGEQELWVQASGAGQASLRYVVRDYPRDGTVYPVTRLNGGAWQWQKFDVSYWAGDLIHIELAHAQDAPLLVVPQDRSWFGLRQAWLMPKGAGPPTAGDEGLAAVFEHWAGQAEDSNHGQEARVEDRRLAGHPRDLAELVSAYEQTLFAAIAAWAADKISDGQAALLDAALQHGLLVNAVAELPTAEPLIRDYRRAAGELKAPIRVPGLRQAMPRDQALFVRGDHRQPAELIPRRFLSLLDSTPYPSTESGRLQLAADLVRDDNPLTRRVIVNRLWHHVFGQGLVATPDNFGKLGAAPSHPELLDWLADQFAGDWQWSFKRTIRAMVMSKTWQQSSTATPEQRERDPQNRFLSIFALRRLEAEAIRDTLLGATGRLDLRMFGEPEADVRHVRRAIYSAVRRNSLDPFLRVFDFPEPATSIGRRDATSVPAQSLTMLNDPLVHAAAVDMAQQLQRDFAAAPDLDRLSELFWRCFGRPPTADEMLAGQNFLAETRAAHRLVGQEIDELQNKLRVLSEQADALVEPLRRRWAVERASGETIGSQLWANALASWNFRLGLADQVGGADAVLRGSARLEADAVVLDGAGYVQTLPLPKALRAKTLEAWVQLENLTQRGGGVLSLQTLDGNTFDSIVYAERDPGQWLAGSELFRRTHSWEGSLETEAATEIVHLVVVYEADGWVQAYRNGQPYGRRYRSDGPVAFEANQSVVTIGLRHLPAGGNRLLSGRVYQARVYDRVLSPAEIAESHRSGLGSLTPRQILAGLSDADQEAWQRLQRELVATRGQLQALQREGHAATPESVWSELIHSLLMSYELISVR